MPYILNTSEDIQLMLKEIGVKDLDNLYRKVSGSLRIKQPLNLSDGFSEFKVKQLLENIAKKNSTINEFNSFLGAGIYDHYVPAALSYILANSQFLTAYTPYQAECSQGILQAIYEYQSYICLLTGMDVSNASLLDGASAFAEAVLMALRITKRKKIILAGMIHPEYVQTLETYLSGLNFSIQNINFGKDGLIDTRLLKSYLDSDVACCCVQSPNFFGLIEDVAELSIAAKKLKALTIMVVNPLSLAILKEPKALGVDIVCGDGQVLGGNLNLGGPTFGFLSSEKDYVRQLPGRIVGRTVDKQENIAYCLTLQAREQHIRREKATSNICSNHSFNAIIASVYLSLLGAEGLKKVATCSFNNAQYLRERLKEIRGITIPYSSCFFNEFCWEVNDSRGVVNKLRKKNIIPGYLLPGYSNRILSCCTEKKSKQDIDNFINCLAEVLHG